VNLELNACMGGMSEGFRRVGVHFDMAVDYDPAACASHERNIGLRPIQMDIRDLVRMARIGAFRPSVDLFVADPPCTPWSMAGDRKGLDDERDLLRETVELITILRPTTWLIGNVPGLDKADNWREVVEPVIYGPMRRAGYCVDYASFNAADYGTPQCRVRPFWFGHHAGRKCIRWATPTHAPPPVLPGVGLRPWVSCGEALEAAFGPRATWGPEVGRSVRLRRRAQNSPQHGTVEGKPARTVGTSNLSDGNVLVDEAKRRRAGKKPRASIPDAPAGVVTSKQNQGDGTVLVLNDKHPPSDFDEPGMAVCAKNRGGAQGGMSLRMPDSNRRPADPGEPHRAVTRVRDQAILADDMRAAGLLDSPSTVVGTRDELTAPGHHDPAVSGSGNSGILLSEEALLVIQGFPRTWHVAGRTKTARMSQIGQAMPPQLSEAVARSIVAWFADARIPLRSSEAA
jgi:site-specific DNA-cytosine methylase